MKQQVPFHIRKIIQETEEKLQKIYATRLKEIVLFGSFARGDFTEDSDIDLVLLLEDMQDIASERARYFPMISQLSLKYDTVISVIPYSVNEFRSKKTPFILNVAKEGVKV